MGIFPERVGLRASSRMIQPQARHARTLIGSVATEAGVGHNGPYVPVEANFVDIGAGENLHTENRHGER